MVPPPPDILEPPPASASEQAHVTTLYYPAVALALLVWSVTPISWIIFASAVLRYYKDGSGFTASAAGWGGAWSIIWYYALLEVPFSLWLAYLTRKAQKHKTPAKMSYKALEALLVQCLDVGLAAHPPTKRDGTLDDSIEAFERHTVTEEEARVMWKCVRRWFHLAAPRDIAADNMREWLAWAFGGCELEVCRKDKERARLIDRGLQLVQDRLRWKFPEGYNSNVKSLRLTLDPVRTLHRPFGYYVVCNGATNATIRWLKNTHGFELLQDGDCEFLIKRPNDKRPRPPQGEESKDRTIIFLHGLGIGLSQYFKFLKYLVKHEAGVVILKQPWLSADISHWQYLSPPDRTEHVRAIKSVIKRLNLPPVTILGHSHGTLIQGWLARDSHQSEELRSARNFLVDPVGFRLWEGSVAHAFVVRKWTTGIEVLLGYFVARELGNAFTIGRNFIWSDMALWAYDLPSHKPQDVQFFFGANDMLIDVPAAIAYLRDAGIPAECVTLVPSFNHGKILFFDSIGMTLVRKHVGL